MLGFHSLGDGAHAVVVLHEWLGDHSNWEPMWPYLNISDFTYIFADLRGYGLSRDMGGDYTVEEAARDVAELAANLGHQRFVLVGHSMSGLIAQQISLDYPACVARQILLCPVPASGFRADEAQLDSMKAVATDRNALRDAVIVRGGGRYGEDWLEEKVRLAWEASSPGVKLEYLRMFTSTDISADVAGSEMPTVVCFGTDDLPFYREGSVMRGFEALYSNLAFHKLDGCGHYPMREKPALTAETLNTLLQNETFETPVKK